jgi:ATP-dependent Clp protease ATP-binding subunit ClpA
LSTLRQTLTNAKEAPDHAPPSDERPYTSRSKRVLELAMSEVRQMGHSYVGTEHLLLGILLVESRASKALNDAGATADLARAEVLRLVGTQKSSRVNAPRGPVFKDRFARAVAAIALLIAALALVVALYR